MVVSFQTIEKNNNSSQKNCEDELFDDNHTIDKEKLELITLLQSTLDLKLMLKKFLEKLRCKLRIDGLSYTEDERHLKIRIGRHSAHSCGYRLSNTDQYCGELVFKRSTRFSESELEQIEDLILLLLAPISNALKYADAVSQAIHMPAKNVIDRSTLLSTLTREIELAKRHNHNLTLGHVQVGLNSTSKKKQVKEDCLEQLGELIRPELCSTDLLFRSANLEFLLLTHTKQDEIEELKCRLLDMNNLQLSNDNDQTQVVVSVGFATLTGTDSINSLIARTKNKHCA